MEAKEARWRPNRLDGGQGGWVEVKKAGGRPRRIGGILGGWMESGEVGLNSDSNWSRANGSEPKVNDG